MSLNKTFKAKFLKNIFLIYQIVLIKIILSTDSLYFKVIPIFKSGMSDSQMYRSTLYLINNMEDNVIFLS